MKIKKLLLSAVFIGLILRIYNLYFSCIYFNRDSYWILNRSLFSMQLKGWASSILSYDSFYQLVLFISDWIFFILGYAAGMFNSFASFEYRRLTSITDFIFLAKSVNIIIALLTVYIVYLIGTRVNGKKMGITAAFFLACSEPHVFFSRTMNENILFTFLICVSFLFSLGIITRGNPKDFIFSGFFAGMTVADKEAGVLALTLPILAFFLQDKSRRRCDKRIIFWLAAASAGFFSGQPLLFWEIPNLLHDLNWRLGMLSGAPAGYSVNPWVIAFRIVYEGIGGAVPFFLFIIGLASCLAGYRGRKTLLLVFFPLFFYSVACLYRTIDEEWLLLPILPFLLLIVACGAVKLGDGLRFLNKNIRRYALVCIIILALVPGVKKIFRLEYNAAKINIRQMTDIWTDKFMRNLNIEEVISQSLKGRGIISGIMGKDIPSSDAVSLPYMFYYVGPNVRISGKVVFKRAKEKAVSVKVRRSAYYAFLPYLATVNMEKSGDYIIEVPAGSRWVGISVVDAEGKVLSVPTVLNIEVADINGVDLIV